MVLTEAFPLVRVASLHWLGQVVHLAGSLRPVWSVGPLGPASALPVPPQPRALGPGAPRILSQCHILIGGLASALCDLRLGVPSLDLSFLVCEGAYPTETP